MVEIGVNWVFLTNFFEERGDSVILVEDRVGEFVHTVNLLQWYFLCERLLLKIADLITHCRIDGQICSYTVVHRRIRSWGLLLFVCCEIYVRWWRRRSWRLFQCCGCDWWPWERVICWNRGDWVWVYLQRLRIWLRIIH